MGKKTKTKKIIIIPEVEEITQENVPEEKEQIIYDTEPENFNLKVQTDSFQDSLKEFYIENTTKEHDTSDKILENKIEKIETVEEDPLLTVNEFNNNYKEYVKSRNSADSPQLYKTVKTSQNINNKQDLESKVFQTINAVTNRNQNVISRTSRSKMPVVKMNSKLSENR